MGASRNFRPPPSFPRRQALSVAASALGLWLLSRRAGAAGNDLAVIVHPENPVRSLDAADLEAIFIASRRYWSGSRAIVAFNLPAKSDARIEFDEVVLHMGPDEVANYWIDRKVRGGTPPPRQVSDPVIVTRLVEKLPPAIGYVPAAHVSNKVKVVARIVERAVKGS